MSEKVKETTENQKDNVKAVVKSGKIWIWYTLVLVIIVIIIISPSHKKHSGYEVSFSENKKEKINDKTTKNGNKSINSFNLNTSRDIYIETCLLEKGKTVRVYTPDGYKCNFYGGGKKYYCQPQNSKKEIWGGGICPTNKDNPNAKYADLSYYDEEITVVCEFKKIK